jgi:hypothetical protein
LESAGAVLLKAGGFLAIIVFLNSAANFVAIRLTLALA